MRRRHGNNGRRLSEQERRELRQRVAEGETFAQAAAAVGCSTKSIQRLIADTGGLRQRVTVRSPLRLALAEREELSRGLVAGDSLRQIASRVRRPVSTLSRELARHGGRSAYRACHAEKRRRAGRGARSPRSWPAIRICDARWSAGCWSAGLPSRSPPGSSVIILTT